MGAFSGFAAGGAGAVGGIIGSAISAAASAKEAKKQRDFQETMYKSRYQNTMADMKLAGLNPILAYQQGVGGNVPGAMGQVPDFGASSARGAEAAVKAFKGKGEKQLLAAQTEAAKGQAYRNWTEASSAQAYGEQLRASLPERRAVGRFYEANPNAALIKEGVNVLGNSARSFFRAPGRGLRGRSRLPSRGGKLESDWMRRNR